MKLHTVLGGCPAFDGIKGSMVVNIEENGPSVTFVFNDRETLWSGLSIKDNDRGDLRAYKVADVTDIRKNVSIPEALIIVRAGLSEKGKFLEVHCDAGKVTEVTE